ncbi:hypothetical protein ACU8IW_002886 [Listeria innocua]|uniref:Uncharacterized protein n=1 Tax=Listeria monocytogenes TaxID=1639 RepID=A0A6C8EP01_LISMN|nr:MULTISPECIES: hypothetical protein [Listeria]EKE4545761.1 hypothetical protein [Listeria monocytogenes serotype 1/2a]EDN6420772.1 hypothetical protein [Listeria monocytogenes]EDN6541036.1 hypothetical protein [Listeria monocytogenes]EDN6629871.1 hypothetical protein [Listeria monocytogenes]EDN7008742.1 hypothetical protein [Listeria monocytogenes]
MIVEAGSAKHDLSLALSAERIKSTGLYTVWRKFAEEESLSVLAKAGE